MYERVSLSVDCDNCCFVSHGPKWLSAIVAMSSVGGVLQVWGLDAMFCCTVKCGIVSTYVSVFIISPGNSLLFLADAPCDKLSTEHAA